MDKLVNSITNLASNLESVRDFVEVFGNEMRDQIESIKTEYSDYVDPVQEAIEKSLDKYEEEEDSVSVPNGYEDVIEIKDVDNNGISFRVKDGYEEGYAEAMEEIEMFEDRAELLYNGSLMNLTSQVEIFFSDLLHFFYDRYPKALTTDDKLFSLDDLDDFETISKAKENYISSKVEGVLRGDFKSWADRLKNDFRVPMDRLEENIEDMIEVFERRNVIVHAGGKVGEKYMNKVSSKYSKDIEEGETLRVTEDYIREKINLAESTCIIAGLESWKKIEESDESRAKLIDELTVKYLNEENFNVLRDVSKFLADDENMKKGYREIARLNYWMCKKRLGNVEEIEDEMNDADFTAMSPRLRIAHASLCERKEQFFDLVEPAIKSEEVSVEELKKAPIFKEMRSVDEFEEKVEKLSK